MSFYCESKYANNSCCVKEVVEVKKPVRTFARDYTAENDIKKLDKKLSAIETEVEGNSSKLEDLDGLIQAAVKSEVSLQVKDDCCDDRYCSIEQIANTVNLGEWSTAITSFTLGDDVCVPDGIPSTIEKRIPANRGDTTDYNGDVWISLIDNNTEEPNLATQLDGKWLNLQTVKDTIISIYDYHRDIESKDDPVIKGKTVFQRLSDIEARITALENK